MAKFFPAHNVLYNGMFYSPREGGYDIGEEDVAELCKYGSVTSAPAPKQAQETLFADEDESAKEEPVAEPVKRKGGRPKKGESPILATATKEDLAKL